MYKTKKKIIEDHKKILDTLITREYDISSPSAKDIEH